MSVYVQVRARICVCVCVLELFLFAEFVFISFRLPGFEMNQSTHFLSRLMYYHIDCNKLNEEQLATIVSLQRQIIEHYTSSIHTATYTVTQSKAIIIDKTIK